MDRMSVRLDDLIDFVTDQHPDGGPLAHLSDAVLVSEHLGELSDHLIGHFVDRARRAGASWTDIGRSMGVSKQAAQKRFVPKQSEAGETFDPAVFTRFTDRARTAVVASQEHARDAGHAQIGVEHLVLGLLDEPESMAAKAMVASGASLEAVRERIVALVPPQPEPTRGPVPFSPGGKKAIELSVREALRLGHNYIGTEHILLGVLSDETSPAAAALTGLGLDHAAVERFVLAALLDVSRRGAPDRP